MKKDFVPGKIMYSGLNGRVIPIQFVRHDDFEVNIYYGRICYGDEFGGEFRLYGLDYLYDTREEALNYALSELGASMTKLPSIEELATIEKSYNVAK
jgi:hypothetical protein